MRRALAALIAIVALAGAIALATGDGEEEARRPPRAATGPSGPAGVAPQRETSAAVSVAGVVEHLRALQEIADRHGGTRAAGTPGGEATAVYVRERLEAAGWQVRMQDVELELFVERPGSPRVEVAGRRLGRREAATMSYSGSGTARGRVRRATGLGCRGSDYVEVGDGEIALVRRGTCFLAEKARLAQRAGAVAVLVFDPAGVFPGTLGDPGLKIPALAIAGRVAERLNGRTVEVAVDAISRDATLQNVIAESPAAGGTGSVAMAGAHLDSVVAGPGINDDGSGIAALLEVAEAVRDAPVRLGFWAAEELGLHGSRRYVRSLDSAERGRIGGYLNLDMVGTPGGRPRVYGAGAVADALTAAGGTAGRTDIGRSSDHASFRRAGIEVGGLFTGLGRCYHRACDTLENVDRALTTRSARTTARALVALAR